METQEITLKKNITYSGYSGRNDYDFSFIKKGFQILNFSHISTGDFYFELMSKDALNKNFLIPRSSEFFKFLSPYSIRKFPYLTKNEKK